MIKKIWLLLMSLFVIFWFWVSFANPIAPSFNICAKFENVEIDNYKLIIETGTMVDEHWFYEPKVWERTKCDYLWFWGVHSNVYLIDKSISIEEINNENKNNEVILLWNIETNECSESCKTVFTYKIIYSWDSYKLELINKESDKINEREYDYPSSIYVVSEKEFKLYRLKKFFPYARLIAIVIETIILFAIAKPFRKENQISNKRLLLFWIIPTTITLPLLWFILPLFIWDWPLYIIIWELLVTAIEAIIIKYWLKVSRWKTILASIACNLCSYLFGLFVL